MDILPLELDAIEVQRAGRRILGPLSQTISRGGPLVVLGPNGSGKSTFLRACHGITRLTGGTARWAMPRADADLRQAFVFQTPILLRRTVLENVIYPLRLRGIRRDEAKSRARRLLADVGLDESTALRASVLSGGEKQKLALARALVIEPDVLFLDEPTASLDGRSTREIEAILNRAVSRGTKLVMATHDLGQARRLAQDVLFLLNGKVIEAAPARQFFDSPGTPSAAAFLKGDIVE